MLNFSQLTFFLGANTPGGFFSLFDELYEPDSDCRMYIVKGGPGTGKSGLMRAVADAVEKEGYLCERILCSGDPDSIDACIFPELNTAIADGTPPHIVEPRFPGAVEQFVHLGDCWDTEALRKNVSEIRRLTKAGADEHRRCAQFLSAVRAIDNDSLRSVSLCVDTQKIENYAKRLAGREFRPGEKQRGRGTEKKRFLSAISPKGVCVLYDSAHLLCGRLIAVRDEYGFASSILLDCLKEHALSRGYNVIACYCPLRPDEKLEHLFIPELDLGFFTENAYHSLPEKASKTIHARRFCDTQRLSESMRRLRFNNKARRDLLGEAICRLELAKDLHDKLESYYIKTMDFSKVQELTQKITDEILNKE